MSTILDFLTDNPMDNVTKQVVISPRLRDRPFTIKAMTSDQFTSYQKEATRIHKGKRVDFSNRRFQDAIVLNHTLEPNFKDAAAIKKVGCTTPEQFLHRSLLAGEVAELYQQITELSGFDQEMDDLVDEAKNS